MSKRGWTRNMAVALGTALGIAIGTVALAQTSAYQPPEHSAPPPPLFDSPTEAALRADAGTQIERNRPPRWALAEHRKLSTALAALQPQRKGVVDAYVVSIALDSDPVFGREAREAGKVLARRYDAAGRTITLAGSDGGAESRLPMGSPQAVSAALARVAELMDAKEDVLILYTTSHGAPFGVVYNDGNEGFGAISPFRLYSLLDGLGISNRLLIISACYSGVFVPMLQSDRTALLTAASADRTSFGCQAENDWTFFGDALVNRALRKPQPLDKAFDEASGLVSQWEGQGRLIPSQPQVSIGAQVATWLVPLETRMPRAASLPVGRPATESMPPPAPGR